MYGYIIQQDQARAKMIKKRSAERLAADSPHSSSSSSFKSTEHRQSTDSSLSSIFSSMTPPSTPVTQVFKQQDFPSEKPLYTSSSLLNPSNSTPRSPRAVPRSSPKTAEQARFKKLQDEPRFRLKPTEIEALKKSWSEKLEPKDAFDVIGDKYQNISEAVSSTEFWSRCLEEMQMTNSNLKTSSSFVKFYSKQFSELLATVIDNIDQNSAKLKSCVEHTVESQSKLFGGATSYYEPLKISFLSTLMDSFADAFDSSLQAIWAAFFKSLIELMLDASKDEDLQTIAEFQYISNLSPSPTASESVFSGSRLSSKESVSSAATTTTSSILDPKQQAINQSALPRSSSVPRKNSRGSVKSKQPSTRSSSNLSKIDSNVSSSSAGTSIHTTSTGKKYYNGKQLPAFILEDLEKKSLKGSADASNASSSSSLWSADPHKNQAFTPEKRSKAKKAGKLINTILFPTGSMGPLIP